MLFVLVAALIALFLIRRALPTRQRVFAASPGTALNLDPIPWLSTGVVRDVEGHRLSTAGRFVGYVDGQSMRGFGLRPGATVLGDVLKSDVDRARVARDDIVVLNAVEYSYASQNYVFRCVEKVNDDGTLSFKRDSNGREHHDRPIDNLVAKITHVID